MASSSREGTFHGTHHLALLGHLARSKVSGILEIKAKPRSAWITRRLPGYCVWS